MATLPSLKECLNEVSAMLGLQHGLDIIDGDLDLTEPTVFEDQCSVVGLAPVKGGLAGLDAETGKPMSLAWNGKYPTIHEKPLIINAGAKQTIFPPPPKPAPPPPPPAVVRTTPAEAHALYNAMQARLGGDTPVGGADRVRAAFVASCVTNPSYYAACKARLEATMPGPAPPAASWPTPRPRKRIIDT